MGTANSLSPPFAGSGRPTPLLWQRAFPSPQSLWVPRAPATSLTAHAEFTFSTHHPPMLPLMRLRAFPQPLSSSPRPRPASSHSTCYSMAHCEFGAGACRKMDETPLKTGCRTSAAPAVESRPTRKMNGERPCWWVFPLRRVLAARHLAHPISPCLRKLSRRLSEEAV